MSKCDEAPPVEWTFRNLDAAPSEHALDVLAALLIDMAETEAAEIPETRCA